MINSFCKFPDYSILLYFYKVEGVSLLSTYLLDSAASLLYAFHFTSLFAVLDKKSLGAFSSTYFSKLIYQKNILVHGVEMKFAERGGSTGEDWVDSSFLTGSKFLIRPNSNRKSLRM